MSCTQRLPKEILEKPEFESYFVGAESKIDQVLSSTGPGRITLWRTRPGVNILLSLLCKMHDSHQTMDAPALMGQTMSEDELPAQQGCELPRQALEAATAVSCPNSFWCLSQSQYVVAESLA